MNVALVRNPATLESLAFEERSEPEVGAGDIKVRWHALSLNFHDYAVAAGLMPVDDGRIPISDGAGEIVDVGDGVTKWKPGDRVMSTFFPDWKSGEPDAETTGRITGDSAEGVAADFSIVGESEVTRMPSGWSFAEASTLPVAGVTAWRALFDMAGLESGDSVLVLGSGGVSVFALQLAKAAGATVYATTSSDEKADRLRELGADHVVNYKTDEEWGATITELSGGGVDVVLEVGGPATLEQSIAAGRYGADIILIGLLTGMDLSLGLPALMIRQQRFHALAVGSHEHQERTVELLESGDIKPVIDRTFPLSELAASLEHLAAGKHFGKVVIELDGDAA